MPLPSLQPPPHRLQLVALEGRREAQLALEAGELPFTDTRLPTTAAPLPCHLAPARSARAPSQSLSVSTTPAESPAFASDALALSLLLAATGMHPTPSAELPPADEGTASGQAAGGTALAYTLAKAAGAGAGGPAGAASSQCSAGSQEGGGLPGSSSVGSAGGGGGGPAKPHGVIKPQARRHALAAASVHNLHRMADPGQLASAGSLPPNLAGLSGLGCWGEVARSGPTAAGPLGLLGAALVSKGGAGGQPNKPELSTGVSEPAGPGVKSSGPSMGRSGGAVEGGLRPADTEGGGPYGGHGEDLGSVGDDERGGDEAVCGRVKAGKGLRLYKGRSGGKFR
ncbi:hypothetical protein HaLaN_27836 [Haematococcus lacustris]|uniref:Uncharacterized protein n=1 Tax=Haematococcus lacustris TaxID=44745 RepID=A0A6A0A994_HAELA|nr:hypothetical protein HaLaN_27836 [Haematococcus lacustris]